MAWVTTGNLKGPKGDQGEKGDPGPPGRDGQAAPKYYGILRWSGPQYNPVRDAWTRLQTNNDGRLYVYADSGGVADTSGNTPRLTAPVTGVYLLTATQVWSSTSAPHGCGLGGSTRDGATDMYLWTDSVNSLFGQVSTMAYLQAGKTLYPWTWNGLNTGMKGSDRGLQSEYSMALIHPL